MHDVARVMTATIWKFPIPAGDEITVDMPDGAVILTVGGVRDEAFVWAMVDAEAPFVGRRLAVRGTGHPLGEVGDYIGTFMLLSGSLVFHVFEAA